jgi:hypothetical protein
MDFEGRGEVFRPSLSVALEFQHNSKEAISAIHRSPAQEGGMLSLIVYGE